MRILRIVIYKYYLLSRNRGSFFVLYIEWWEYEPDISYRVGVFTPIDHMLDDMIGASGEKVIQNAR